MNYFNLRVEKRDAFFIVTTLFLTILTTTVVWHYYRNRTVRMPHADPIPAPSLHLPDTPTDAHVGRAELLFKRSRNTIINAQKFLEQHPNDPGVMYSMATAYDFMGDYEHAKPIYEHLYRVCPDLKLAIENKLYAIYYRERDWHKAECFFDNRTYWLFDGRLAGKTVLLRLDNSHGRGDALQHVRYAKYLHDAGARVTVELRDELIPLFSLCPFIDTCIPCGSKVAPKDYTYESVPTTYMMRYREKIPPCCPYIFADPKRVAAWKARVASDTHFKIGLCWHTCFIQLDGKLYHSPRSIDFSLLAPLSTIKGVSWYNLQLPINHDELAQCKELQLITFDDLDSQGGAFMDTAALIKNLDLVITVDTSIAHLAGALGVPVWTLLIKGACWRWFTNQLDTLLYPTMKLFRQLQQGDWDPVIKTVVERVSELVKNRELSNRPSHTERR